jgi:hypothetical protein
MASWYNGSLDKEINYDEDLALENVRSVAIVGNGNVAMDISRVLMKEPDVMAPYDIPSSVLAHLRKKHINSISLIGRRGAVQSAFTIKEIREISRIPGLKLYALKQEILNSFNEASQREMHPDFSTHARGVHRRNEFLKENCVILES